MLKLFYLHPLDHHMRRQTLALQQELDSLDLELLGWTSQAWQCWSHLQRQDRSNRFRSWLKEHRPKTIILNELDL